MIVGGLVIFGFVCLAAAAVSLFCGRSPQTVVVDDRSIFFRTSGYGSYGRMGRAWGYGYGYDCPPPAHFNTGTDSPFFQQQRAVVSNIYPENNAPQPYNADGNTAPPHPVQGGGQRV